MAQIIQELLIKHAFGAEKVNVLLIKVKVFDVIDDLL